MSEFQNEKCSGECPERIRKTRRTVNRKEVGADFVLPDYMGDVKRMLKCTAHVIPCNKLVCDGEVSALATVTFRVLYLDGEDMLTEASFSADAEFSERSVCDSRDVDVEYKIQSVSVRLGGPRKISAKANVSCEMSLSEDDEVGASVDCSGAETLKKEIKIRTEEYFKTAEREYAEEIDKIDGASADEIELVKSFAEAFVDAVHKTDGGVNLSGYINAYCIIRTDDGLIRVEKQIPIEEHIECEHSESGDFIPRACVTGINVNLNNVNTENECAVSVVMNMTAECCLTHHYNKGVMLVTDAFCEGCKNECCYENFEFSTLTDSVFDKAGLSLTLNRGEEPLRDIMESDISVKNVRYELNGSELTALCDAEITIIARGNEREECYAVKEKTEFSKKYRLSVKDAGKISISIVPCEASVSFDGEKIYVDGQMLVSLISESKEVLQMLSDLKSEKEIVEGERCVIVCYPEKEDTLWSVSKKYGVSPDTIGRINGFSKAECDLCMSVADKDKIIIIKE